MSRGTPRCNPRRLLSAAIALMLGVGVAALAATPPAAALATVTTEAELRAAFANPAETEIVLGADIDLTCSEPEPLRHLGANLRIDGAGHTIAQTCDNTGIMEVFTGLTVEETTLTGGRVSYSDGVARVGGGAIYSPVDTEITVIRSAFIDNSAIDGSTGFYLEGGAIWAGGDVTIVDSTFANNVADAGGAIYSYGNVTATNSTFTGNRAYNGMALYGYGDISLTRTTIAGNVPLAGDGAIVDIRQGGLADGSLSLFGSVLLDGPNNPACSAEMATVSTGYNFSTGTSCRLNHPSDLEAAGSSMLGGLAYYGGPTPTSLPGAGSPLIDAIPEEDCRDDIATDQRGISRPQGAGCDIGAVEVEVPNTPPVAEDQQVTTPQDIPVDIELLASDPEGDDLVFAVEEEPQHGTLSTEDEIVTYTPAAGYSGADSFTFTAIDPAGAADTGTVSITVTPVDPNTPPVADQGPGKVR